VIGAAVLAAAALLLLPALVISAATGGIELQSPSRDADADIPPAYLLLYQQAAVAVDIPWEVLAAVGKVECDHGRHPHPSCRQQGAENEAGAGGPMQFLAATWQAYGLDADSDGIADRWDAADAIVSAANYLAASGARDDLRGALYAYNHSRAYVATVLAWAARYRHGGPMTVEALPQLGDARELAQAVLASPNIDLRPAAASDVRAGRVDARVLAILLALSQQLQLGDVGPFVTGHSYYVHGSDSPSNHAFGRAVDIGSVGGVAVSAANDRARAAALALASLPSPLRPGEVGSPFADLAELLGFFSDDDHRDHIHIGFDA
jgi:hypothetical protein